MLYWPWGKAELAFTLCFVQGFWEGTSSFLASALPACRTHSTNELNRASVDPPGYLHWGKKENNLFCVSFLMSARLIKPPGCMEVTQVLCDLPAIHVQ